MELVPRSNNNSISYHEKEIKTLLVESINIAFRIGTHLIALFDEKKKENAQLTATAFYKYCSEAFGLTKDTIYNYLDAGSLYRILDQRREEFEQQMITNEFQARQFSKLKLKKQEQRRGESILRKFNEDAVIKVWKHVTTTYRN